MRPTGLLAGHQNYSIYFCKKAVSNKSLKEKVLVFLFPNFLCIHSIMDIFCVCVYNHHFFLTIKGRIIYILGFCCWFNFKLGDLSNHRKFLYSILMLHWTSHYGCTVIVENNNQTPTNGHLVWFQSLAILTLQLIILYI